MAFIPTYIRRFLETVGKLRPLPPIQRPSPDRSNRILAQFAVPVSAPPARPRRFHPSAMLRKLRRKNRRKI